MGLFDVRYLLLNFMFLKRTHTVIYAAAYAACNLVLRPGNNYECRASQRIPVKTQSAGNGRCPFQGLQRRIGSSGTLPLGESGPSIQWMLAARGAGGCP